MRLHVDSTSSPQNETSGLTHSKDSECGNLVHALRMRAGIIVEVTPQGALLDRLTHHVHILEMNGESYRLATSMKAQRRPAQG